MKRGLLALLIGGVLLVVLVYAWRGQGEATQPEPELVCQAPATAAGTPNAAGNAATTPVGASESPKPPNPPASDEAKGKKPDTTETTQNPVSKPQDPPPPPRPTGTAPNPSQLPTPAETRATPANLHMPDGQLVSHVVQIYLDRDITSAAHPRLYLLENNAVTSRSKSYGRWWAPRLVAPGQKWTQSIAGAEETKTGTLILFDLKSVDFQYKAIRRVKPVVCYWEGQEPQKSVGERDVNLGNIVYAGVWAVGVSLIGLALIIVLAKSHQGEAMQLLTAQDGHLSLAQLQITLWTIAVGTIVLGYGFVRLAIPEIPESLVVLMGASLATGGLAFFGDMKNQGNAPPAAGAPAAPANAAAPGAPANPAAPPPNPIAPPNPPARMRWRFRDLVENFEDGRAEPSLAKAQMLFWTVILIVLFVSKSVLDGAIWNVPWPLVALMGFSQAGFVVPKLAPKT